ncbi:MAG: hypothetical protein DCF19_23175 [Pseudanabaena frigida]|uniref:Uncharacterized protein n=1 Tax=Pseudanabaena frigida TaxID=945775 RepID=A0A2W4XJ12_9CYAN|nr:MAG: hypothetical protein DCF19_23175 [Pseudanabaena frigida]
MKFAIEGEGAIEATEELLTLEGIEGSFTVDEEVQREGVIATIASIVGIVSGTLAVAEQIRKWYQAYKDGKSGKKIAKVLIVGRNGDRLLLENATIEQIRKVLES